MLFRSGFTGDGGPATIAKLNSPLGVAADAAGNLFIADRSNQAIRKVSAGGIITTVAGRGTDQGFGGDGGLATAALLNYPRAVAVDATGNLFIADTENLRIRKVSTSGIITTIAGDGVAGNGLKWFSGDGGIATAALLNDPYGVAVDAAGNVFIADTGNERIRKVSASGIITTIAGNGTPGFTGDGGPSTGNQLDYPMGISTDAKGNLFTPTGSQVRELISSPQLATGCQYAIDQAQQAFTTDGGGASVGVLASVSTCPWLALSYTNWVTISSGAVGSGTGLVTYSVAPNPNSASRTATLWIASKSLSVTQSGLTCALDVPTRNVSVAATGVAGATMTVSSNAPDCSWSATANVPWILLPSPSNGTGTGAIAYTVGVNTGGLRTGAIRVAGRTVYINQVGAGGSTTSLASITNGGVVNAASYAPLIAPGSFVAI